MKASWIVDRYMLDLADERECPSLVEALLATGTEHVVLSTVAGGALSIPPAWDRRPVVAYGSFRFMRQIGQAAKSAGSMLVPGFYAATENLSFSAFASRHGDLLLNSDFVILPFGELRRRGARLFPSGCFVRPNSGTKAFTGMVVSAVDFDHEMNALASLHHVTTEELLVVSKPKQIVRETRFVIVSGKVVAGSTYGWNGNADIGFEIDPESRSLAETVAARDWQPDRAYTCDVALVRSQSDSRSLVARMVELNSFSCAGLYASDPLAVVQAVSKAAEEDWADLF